MSKLAVHMVLQWTLVLAAVWLRPTVAAAAGVQLHFTPTHVTTDVGETKIVRLKLLPHQESVIGVDVVLQFDPQLVKIEDIASTGVFSQRFGPKHDNGRTRVSFANTVDTYQTKAEDIAQVFVTGLKETSRTTVTIEFAAGKTQDSNVAVAGGRDALTAVNTLTVTVKSGDRADATLSSESSEETPTSGIVSASQATAAPTGRTPQRRSSGELLSPLPKDEDREPHGETARGSALGASQASPAFNMILPPLPWYETELPYLVLLPVMGLVLFGLRKWRARRRAASGVSLRAIETLEATTPP